MEMKIRKIWPLIGAFCFTLSSLSLSANTYGSDPSGKNSNQPHQQMSSSLTDAGPRVQGGWDVFISADYIFWKTNVDLGNTINGPTLETKTIVDGTTGNAVVTTGGKSRSTQPDFSWSSGFKVALGVNLPHDDWILDAQYTWLSPKSGSTASVPVAASTNTTTASPNAYRAFDSGEVLTDYVKNHVKLSHNVLDLNLGRNFHVSEYFTLKPYAGIKGTWQSLSQRTHTRNGAIKYFLADSSTTNNFTADTNRVRVAANMWSLGVGGGLDMGMFITKNFSMIAKVGFTESFQNLRTSYKSISNGQDSSYATATTVERVTENSQKNYRLCPIVDTYLGLDYGSYFQNERYRLGLSVGYETHWYGNWVNLPVTVDGGSNQGHLAFQGLDVKLRFDF